MIAPKSPGEILIVFVTGKSRRWSLPGLIARDPVRKRRIKDRPRSESMNIEHVQPRRTDIFRSVDGINNLNKLVLNYYYKLNVYGKMRLHFTIVLPQTFYLVLKPLTGSHRMLYILYGF